MIEEGVERFHHRGSDHAVVPGQVVTINPGEVHDGEPGTREGFRYRMMYPSEGLVADILSSDGFARPNVHFVSATADDPDLARAFVDCHRLLERSDSRDDLWEQQRLSTVLKTLFERWGQRDRLDGSRTENERAIRAAADYIRANAARGILLRDVATIAGFSKYHFLRSFSKVLGISPHAYRMLCCVERAKAFILGGGTIAAAAAEAGFADQSHCTRWFRAVYGVAPGEFRRSCLSGKQFRSR